MSTQNLGTLLVKMNAETKALAKDMRDGLREVQQAVQAMKQLSSEVAQAGAALTSFFGGMVRAAASVAPSYSAVHKSVVGVKDSFLTLAMQVTQMLLPALHELGALLRGAADWFAGLPASTRETLSNFALFAVKAGALGFALSKVAGIASSLIGIFRGVMVVMAAIGAGPMALIIATLVSLLVLIATLHKAWRTNWNGMRDTMKGVLETMGGWWGKFAGFLKDIWDGIVDSAAQHVKAIVLAWLEVMKLMGKMSERDANLTRIGVFSAISGTAMAAKDPGMVKALALQAGEAVKAAGLDVVRELKIMAREAQKALGLTSSGGHAAGVDTEGMYSEDAKNRRERDIQRGKRFGGGMTAAKATRETVEAAAEFWKGLETLGPLGARIASFASELVTVMGTALKDIGAALAFGGNLLTSKLEEMGQVIQSAISGAQSGGVWGALLAVLLELFARFEGFQQVLDIANGQLKQLIDQLAPVFTVLIDALRPLMGAVGIISTVVLNLLAPIFKALGSALESIVPLIMAVAIALQFLQPVFDLLGTILDLVFKGLGYVMRFVGLSILAVVGGLLEAWIGILKVVWTVLDAVGANKEETERLLEDAVTKSFDLKDAMGKLAATGMLDVANAAADASEGLGKTADSARDVSEALLNVPIGIKVNELRFMATVSASSGGSRMLDERRQQYLQTGNPSPASRFTKPK